MAMTLLDLLAGNGAARILETVRPRFTEDEYLAYSRRVMLTVTFDGAAL
jgi:hypothetical protein